MAYVVNLTARAEHDLEYLFAKINAEQSDAAWEWYQGLKQAILSLEGSPNRGSVTAADHRLRQLLYGNKPDIYRVIYRVVKETKQVTVLHIRHGARRKFKRPDVD